MARQSYTVEILECGKCEKPMFQVMYSSGLVSANIECGCCEARLGLIVTREVEDLLKFRSKVKKMATRRCPECREKPCSASLSQFIEVPCPACGGTGRSDLGFDDCASCEGSGVDDIDLPDEFLAKFEA